ncbi:MAG: molybdopterin-dependent oxidoreductase, partial [Alphaproteobacteria bacterium]|nr:molybdopterin-dependent oxidoreductase [Alphaproteobacteria bacterium]
ASSGDIEVLFLLHADELDSEQVKDAFVIYQGSHGDAGARNADVILPGSAYTEKNATWVNTEGRVQLGRRSVFPPGDAREDWTILRALSGVMGETLPYDNLGQLRARMLELAPHFSAVDELVAAEWGTFGAEGDVSSEPFVTPIKDYYLTNPICRASEIMAQCTAIERGEDGKETGGATGTDG